MPTCGIDEIGADQSGRVNPGLFDRLGLLKYRQWTGYSKIHMMHHIFHHSPFIHHTFTIMSWWSLIDQSVDMDRTASCVQVEAPFHRIHPISYTHCIHSRVLRSIHLHETVILIDFEHGVRFLAPNFSQIREECWR